MSASSDIFMCTSNSSSRTVFLVQSQFYQRSHKPSTKVLMTQRVSNFTKETWMPKRSNVCFRGVWNMCLVVRLTLNRRCRISVRNENGDIQVFQKFDCAYFTALSEQSFWNSQKSLQIFIVYQLCLNKSAEAVVCWVKCQHRLSQLRTDLHLFPSWFWVRIYYYKIHEKI